ncbi:MAG: hypothetical protein PVF96_06265 [Candidatus Bathyarchaeota archaeon]|jgi:hypothetical protein
MKRYRREFKSSNSGQLLIVAAMTIAILISTTTIYVYELSRKPTDTDDYPINDALRALKQSTVNAMISSLGNISQGGETTNLQTNLNQLSQLFRNLHQPNIHQLSFTVTNHSGYIEGIMLSWETEGAGVSSTHANFTLMSHGLTSNVNIGYTVNKTTSIEINGSCTTARVLNPFEVEKLVNLTCQVFNGEDSALAENITIYYFNIGSWTVADSSNDLSIMDHGNGTYSISFTIITSLDDVQVSTHVRDLRNIFVQANTTCYDT